MDAFHRSKPMLIHNPDGTFTIQKEPPNWTAKDSKAGNGLAIPPQIVVPVVPATEKKPWSHGGAEGSCS
jgi:hypothetical protein